MKTLFTEDQLRQGIDRLAGEIRQHYQQRPLTIVGVLIGSVDVHDRPDPAAGHPARASS